MFFNAFLSSTCRFIPALKGEVFTAREDKDGKVIAKGLAADVGNAARGAWTTAKDVVGKYGMKSAVGIQVVAGAYSISKDMSEAEKMEKSGFPEQAKVLRKVAAIHAAGAIGGIGATTMSLGAGIVVGVGLQMGAEKICEAMLKDAGIAKVIDKDGNETYAVNTTQKQALPPPNMKAELQAPVKTEMTPSLTQKQDKPVKAKENAFIKSQPEGNTNKHEIVVGAGDTLTGIAKRMNLGKNGVQLLADANGIENPDKIQVGQHISLPQPKNAPKP